MKFSVFQLSRLGGREKNEDRMGYCYTREASIFLLADGMGGHPEGEVAARLAVNTVAARFKDQVEAGISDPAVFLREALLAAHQEIKLYALRTAAPDTPRTTLVAALILEGRLSWIHCGDSRFYLVRRGTLQAQTLDHSFVARPRLQPGDLVEAQIRHVLYTCLGCPGVPEFDLAGPQVLLPGDKFLLCSDGLWDSLTEHELVEHLTNLPVAEAVPFLVERALQNAGPESDNVTALALEWDAAALEPGGTTTVFTDSMAHGVFASTLHAKPAWAQTEEMDDAAIDRSIAEINEVIRQAAARRR